MVGLGDLVVAQRHDGLAGDGGGDAGTVPILPPDAGLRRRTLGRHGPPRRRTRRDPGGACRHRRLPRPADRPGDERLGRRRARRRPSTAASPAAATRRGPPDLLLPDPPRDPGRGRLDQPGRPQPRLPAAHRPARRRVRRGLVLRPVLHRAAAGQGRPRVRRHGLPPRRRRADLRGPRARAGSGRPPARRRGRDLAAQPVPRPVRAGARRPLHGRRATRPSASPRARCGATGLLRGLETRRTADRSGLAGAPDTRPARAPRRPAPVRPAGRRHRPAPPGPRGADRSDQPHRLSAPTAATAPSREAIAMGPGAGDRGGHHRRGPRARRRRVPRRPQVGRRARAPGTPKYVVCNADEAEPGTFKDRAILEEDPFALVEAMTIAGFAVGAERGFLYLRGEYPLAEARLRTPSRRRVIAGTCWPRRHGRGLRLRHRDPPRRRRLHLRRGDRAARVHRGQAGRAAQQAAVPRGGRACSSSPPSSTTSRPWSTSRGSSSTAATEYVALGTDGVQRPQAVQHLRPRRAAGRLRGRVRR